MRLGLLIAGLLVAVCASPVFAQESTREDFREFCHAMQGRWVGDVTWVADWPGFGKRGEKVTAYSESKLAEDGNALMIHGYGGTGSGTWLVAFDAGAKRITSLSVTSGGSVGQSIFYRSGNQWVEKGSGSTADGAKYEYTSTLTISDNGNTHTWTGPTTVDGKRVDDQHDVWRRVSK